MNKKSKLIGLILTFAVVGCDLEVNNPNSLLEKIHQLLLLLQMELGMQPYVVLAI